MANVPDHLPAIIVYQNAFHTGIGRDRIHDRAVIGMPLIADPVDLIDVKRVRVQPHVQVAAVQRERVCLKTQIGLIAFFLKIR
jgi:hypothetical protein